MKTIKLFKASIKVKSKVKLQTIDKKQLEKVTGGTESFETSSTADAKVVEKATSGLKDTLKTNV